MSPEDFARVLIVPHVRKAGVTDTLLEVSSWLESRGVRYWLLAEDAEALRLDVPTARLEDLGDIDLCVALGGDGTMLHAVDVVWGMGVPLVGVNIGKMGFLTAAEAHQASEALEAVYAGDYVVSERLTVGCVLTAGGAPTSFRALNEIVVGKLVRERLIHLLTHINGEFFMRYSGDGLIFASSTGSTAYSLSAGGPIVTPDVRCLLMTPICAHMLFSRPIVLDAGDRVTVTVEGEPESLSLSVDGRLHEDVPPGATIEFSAGAGTVKIIELAGSSFYGTIRRKFMSPPACEEPDRQ